MQDLDKTKCESIPVGDEGRLIDRRDNKVYWVAKLKNNINDGAFCWMTQNLDYDGGTIDGYAGYDVIDLVNGTNFASNTATALQYYDPGYYVYTNGSTTTNCGAQTLSNGLKNCSGWKNVDVDTITDTTLPLDAATTIELHYAIGNYYSWKAATGGSSASTNMTVNTSICPSGWSLPIGDGSGDVVGGFYQLANGLSDTQITVGPYYYVYGGFVYGTSLSSIGKVGYYWSGTTINSTDAHFLSVTDSFVLPTNADNNNRYQGYSVRCIAR